ncbi:type II toxin-antitoxin system VapC family toxin [Haloarchaeobius litoreus]|uniref:Type II toxin-antitoxin system VapC family toxin n=1 Tax=Haloarchaeobius litoreus TaxID=755306 RepID=A0ABD6DMF3_9EURY|nr:type II toxin-antitoxin system VapC family toxin [Haloarchaeobius litoreus]
MSVFVDTGVFYAQHDSDATRHEPAVDAMRRLASGEFGRVYTSDYVYDEAVTLTRQRFGDHAAARTLGERIRGTGEFPKLAELLHVTEAEFEATVELFDRYDDQSLSFTDANTVALAESRDIDHVLSFDDDFDGLVERLQPSVL